MGRWVWAHTLRVYKVSTKNWLGSLAKRRLYLRPGGVISCTPLSAIVLLSEFVSQNMWLQHFPCSYAAAAFFFFPRNESFSFFLAPTLKSFYKGIKFKGLIT